MGETKWKGQIAEAAVLADSVRKGYRVSIPFSEDCPYDLIVDRDGCLHRVQCKYTESDGDVVEIRCTCTNNWVTTRYTSITVDWIATYDRTSDRCYYVPSSLLGEKGRSVIHLRLTPTRNNQRRGVNWASDYTDW